MEISFQGEYDRRTYFRGVRMLYASRGWRQVTQWLMALALAGGIGFLLVNFRNYDAQSLTRYIMALGLLGLLVGYNLLMPAIIAARLWNALPRGMSIGGRVSAQGLTFQHGGAGRFLEWKQFIRVRRSQDLVAFSSQGGLIAILPRHFFKTEKDWVRFDQWAAKCARQPQMK